MKRIDREMAGMRIKTVEEIKAMTEFPNSTACPNCGSIVAFDDKEAFARGRAAGIEVLEEAAQIVEDTDVEVYGTAGSYERYDNGPLTLRNAAKAVRALKDRALAKPESPAPCEHKQNIHNINRAAYVCDDCNATSTDGVTWTVQP